MWSTLHQACSLEPYQESYQIFISQIISNNERMLLVCETSLPSRHNNSFHNVHAWHNIHRLWWICGKILGYSLAVVQHAGLFRHEHLVWNVKCSFHSYFKEPVSWPTAATLLLKVNSWRLRTVHEFQTAGKGLESEAMFYDWYILRMDISFVDCFGSSKMVLIRAVQSCANISNPFFQPQMLLLYHFKWMWLSTSNDINRWKQWTQLGLIHPLCP